MKVRDVGQVSMDMRMPVSIEDKKIGQDLSRGFRRQMNDCASAEYDKYLQQLQDNIKQQGELVANRTDMKELAKYRRLITELLNETTSNAYACYKLDRFDAHGRHQTFSIIKKVNQKLDEMAATVLDEQADNLQLLQMADDIRGMLVDLFL